jgi:hypothetical protein
MTLGVHSGRWLLGLALGDSALHAVERPIYFSPQLLMTGHRVYETSYGQHAKTRARFQLSGGLR